MNKVLELQKMPQTVNKDNIGLEKTPTITITVTITRTAFWSTQSNHC